MLSQTPQASSTGQVPRLRLRVRDSQPYPLNIQCPIHNNETTRRGHIHNTKGILSTPFSIRLTAKDPYQHTALPITQGCRPISHRRTTPIITLHILLTGNIPSTLKVTTSKHLSGRRTVLRMPPNTRIHELQCHPAPPNEKFRSLLLLSLPHRPRSGRTPKPPQLDLVPPLHQYRRNSAPSPIMRHPPNPKLDLTTLQLFLKNQSKTSHSNVPPIAPAPRSSAAEVEAEVALPVAVAPEQQVPPRPSTSPRAALPTRTPSKANLRPLAPSTTHPPLLLPLLTKARRENPSAGVGKPSVGLRSPILVGQLRLPAPQPAPPPRPARAQSASVTPYSRPLLHFHPASPHPLSNAPAIALVKC